MLSVQWDAWGRFMQTLGNTTSIRERLGLLSLTDMPSLVQLILMQQAFSRAAKAS